MEKLFTTAFLCMLLLTQGSFKHEDREYKNVGYFFAVIDNKNMFELRDNYRYRAELVNKNASIDGRTVSHVVNAMEFYGNNFVSNDGKSFEEVLTMDIDFNNGRVSDDNGMVIEMKYDGESYFHLPAQSKFKTYRIDWSSDQRYFYITADFDLKMKRWGFPSESQPVIKVKGRMSGIKVTVPAWVQLRSSVQTVQGN
jgi:hypothetical protein